MFKSVCGQIRLARPALKATTWVQGWVQGWVQTVFKSVYGQIRLPKTALKAKRLGSRLSSKLGSDCVQICLWLNKFC